MKYLYHGSHIQNLKSIKPNESGHRNNYVYAVSEPAFAAIFSVRQRNSLVAMWGRNDSGIPFFCEKVKGSFDMFYKNKRSSIYILDARNFIHNDNLWKEEYISEHEEMVVEEIRVKNVKRYLLKLEKEGTFQLIKYKDRKKHFPHIDEDGIDDVKKLIEKYGEKEALKVVERWRPDLLDRLKPESQTIDD